MSNQVVSTAAIACTFGASPSLLSIIPSSRVLGGGLPAGTIIDAAPIVNIATFGMCASLGNPAVVTATAAAAGVLTPMPCTPATIAWVTGSPTVLIGGVPALDADSTCQCTLGGVITITSPGQLTVSVP